MPSRPTPSSVAVPGSGIPAIVTEMPAALVRPNQSSRCVEGVVRHVKLMTVPTGAAGSRMKVVVAINASVRLTAIGPAGLTWLKATQDAVVQVRAPWDEKSGACQLSKAFELTRKSGKLMAPKMALSVSPASAVA